MMKRLISLGAAALASLVGGCGDGPSTVPGFRSPATWSSFVYATNNGPLLLDVVGDPFASGSGDLRRVAVAAMAAGIPGRPFTLTLDPAVAARPNFRIVLVAGAASDLDERAVCAGRAKAANIKIDGGRIDLIATFCDGDSLLSSVRGWVAKIGGADDRRFSLLLGQMTRDLMGEPQ
ncbi:hypothetical protein CU669_06250 [Paramagnetospirillum kuznetsovii]|uniref:DUF4136 domain-containing protein n=1 Tax=Paramagnetospirillum kuznetsovii TaxID=2053833 RepID=A0A364P0X0_9PROT|nr:hypothetical protein [Paramagnetospirillum kuznetsovii]RAU22974.1 hypothetical protein CU669_06250 [Paramagnetospirillum kuznetsovii]